MSFNNKRQSIPSFSKRWLLNKTHSHAKPNNHPYRKSSYQKPAITSFSKSLPKHQKQKPSSFAPPLRSSTFITSNPSPQPFTSLMKIAQSPEEHHQNIDIDKLETKIDKLLKEKLKILIEFNKHKLVSKSKDAPFNLITVQSLIKINEELEGLIAQIKTNIEGYQSNKNIQKWKFLDKKIKMLEKVLAENYSQVEVMKKFYAKVSHSGTSYRNFCKGKQESNVNKIKGNQLQLLRSKMSNSLSPTARLPFISQTKVQYKTPSTNFNKLNKSLATHKTLNYQKGGDQYIIQTSAYKRSFKRYPNLDDVNITHRHCSLPFNPFAKTSDSTSYKNHYMQPYKSKQEKVNYKKLDCYKNKIKPVNLNYSLNIDKPLSKRDNEEYIRMNYSINKAMTQPQVMLTPGFVASASPFTPMAEGEDKLYRARPKNNRLEALKSSFRSFITSQ